jgi:hypothetical protein
MASNHTEAFLPAHFADHDFRLPMLQPCVSHALIIAKRRIPRRRKRRTRQEVTETLIDMVTQPAGPDLVFVWDSE